MTVRAVCEKCNHKWDLEMKPMRTITCPNCKTVYNALIVVNDPENKETMRIVREHRKELNMNKIEIDGKITKIVKSKSLIAKDITGYHILVTTDWRNPFTIFAMLTGESEWLVEGEEVTVTGSLAKYGDFCISADSICKKETYCKYCGEVIPKGHYCCNSCWKEFEE